MSSARGLAWSDIGFSVRTSSALSRALPSCLGGALAADGDPPSKHSTKSILSGVSGIVRQGELLYILGPSGSGKSSTLDALALRVRATVRGFKWLHGRPSPSATEWRTRAKYVEQEDNLFEVLTVQETLETAAELYVPDSQGDGGAKERRKRVDDAIDRLGLGSVRNVKVGGTFWRGISGGQKRRVAIGCELVGRPDVLLVDEPTSGLDSASALRVMEFLQAVARSGVAVVATVHQPAKRVWELADSVCFLSKGSVVYFGDRECVVDYFEGKGVSLPERVAVSEWVLEETNGDFWDDDSRVQRLVDAWDDSKEKKRLDKSIREWADGKPTARGEDMTASNKRSSEDQALSNEVQGTRGKYARGFLAQTFILAKRNLKDAMRNPAVIYLRFAMYFALALLIGIAWLRVPAKANRMQDLLGALFFANAFLVFMAIAVLPVYLSGLSSTFPSPLHLSSEMSNRTPNSDPSCFSVCPLSYPCLILSMRLIERRIVTRERMNGGYSVSAYLMGHLVIEGVMLGVLSLCVTAVLYSMVNLHPTVDRAFFWALTLWLSLMVAESIMILISSIVPMFIVGIAAGAFLFGAFMVVQGFFTRVEFIPWPLRWLGFIGLHSYSFAAMVINEFDGRTYAATPNSFPPFPNDVDGVSVVNNLDFISNSKWVNIAVIAVMLVVYRFLAFLWISKFHNGKK